MADAHIDETVFIPINEVHNEDDMWGHVGVVVYYRAFAVNGVQIWMVPE